VVPRRDRDADRGDYAVTPHHVEVIAHVAPLVVGLVLLIVLELITAAVLGALGVIEIG
jgi:hypothetical protein